MSVIKSFFIALAMYSKIPVPHTEWKEEDMKFVFVFFPFVGVVIGAIELGWFYLCAQVEGIPDICKVFIAAAIPIAITGGIHVDGFMDTMDAFHSYREREKKLEILKDPHIGAFAVIRVMTLAAVYLASVLATHAQKGLPAFGMYGHEVQEADAEEIPEDVTEMLLRFGRAAVAVASLRGTSYLQIGSVTMGIGGSIIDEDFIEAYLGMRVESVDEVEVIRRMTEGIYDEEEYQRALAWTKERCKECFDKNPDWIQKSREVKDEQWEFTVRMYVIIKDLMRGNEKLAEKFPEEALGHNAIAGGFQGQRQWTDFYPNCDYCTGDGK